MLPTRLIPYGRHSITEEDIAAVVEVLRSDNLTQGPKPQEFEQLFAKYVGARYAAVVSSGAAALHLCAVTLGVKPGDKVITTPITFTASANCVRYCGGDVVFSDIDEETYLLDIHKVRTLLESMPAAERSAYKGVIPVDFAGLPVDMCAWRELADEFGLWILEDACHAPGAAFYGNDGCMHRVGDGTLANLAIFSFHPVKHIAAGEGGAVTTNNLQYYEQICRLRTHGITRDASLLHENHGAWYYEMHELGFNYRLSDIHAALAIAQLKRADKNLQRRRSIAQRYIEAFRGTRVVVRPVPQGFEHAYHLFVVELEKRDELYNFLRERKIAAQVHYIPVHLQPYYRQFGWKRGDMPVAERYYKRCLSLPMFPSLTDEEQEYVIHTVIEFVTR
ncbi:MAG: UDP-4-amino-4,6-dideoxy-N-acetyl-beta-L-altrosamine transaminase [Bacteroidota bacterium]|nr:UDP-4-amino-4,6-dideoxy-N-acetyl-beta-L-altrosamine transaminase [Candidatus Kapabacteria bacterium]MDW8221176.1 UDP-4-amino-4,6-dideoxy-N-acetyl-beta-L-altrosamine transaminase [Bacteroidota bacterium]